MKTKKYTNNNIKKKSKDQTLAWQQFANGETPSSVNLDKIFYKTIPTTSKILDFGCAWGRVPFELQKKGYSVTGIDINKQEIKRANEFAKESNKKYSNQLEFITANALNIPSKNQTFEACLMQAFMTTLIIPSHREKVLDEAQRVLKKNGTLYLGVFGQTWENPKYQKRYEQHFKTTKEEGTFIVTEDGTQNTPELYRVHHYTKKELLKLLEPRFNIETFKKTTFTSYHKNKANGFIITVKNNKQK